MAFLWVRGCVFVCVSNMPVCFVCDVFCDVVWFVFVCLLRVGVRVCVFRCARVFCL